MGSAGYRGGGFSDCSLSALRHHELPNGVLATPQWCRYPKEGERGATTATQTATKPTPSSPSSADRKPLRLTQYPVQTLPFLQELLRPSAAARVAAAARSVQIEVGSGVEPRSGATDDGRSISAGGVSVSGGDSGTASAVSLPPPTYAATAAVYGATFTPAESPKKHVRGATSPGAAAASSSASAVRSTPAESSVASPQVHHAAVPSHALLLECASQLSALLAQWRACNAAERRDTAAARPPLPPSSAAAPSGSAGGSKGGGAEAGQEAPQAPQQPEQQKLTRPSSERVLQLMDVVLWYCLATSDDVRLAHGGRSHGTSGRATPALPGTAAAAATNGAGGRAANVGGSSTPYGGGRGGRGGRGGSVGRSGSSSADTMGTGDWLGSRMSAASSVVSGPSLVLSDDQLAEHLFRPAVDAVVLLQDQRFAATTTPQAAGVGGKKEKGGHKTAAAAAAGQAAGLAEEKELGVELQTVALWLLAATLVRFGDAPFNASVFLPVLFPQVDIRGTKGAAARHPLLQPLLRGGEKASESSAMSLRCGAAAALTALVHKLQPTLQYAEEPQPNRQAFVSLATQCGTALLSLHESLCWGLECEGATTAATPLLNTYAAVVAATPYNRCPRSRAVVLLTLQLPVIRSYLAHDDGAEYVPTTALVSGVFKNESMRGAAAQLLSNPLPPANTSKGKQDAVDAKAGGAFTVSSFLAALLQHADKRVEVWRCMVPLSRLYPRMVHSEFDQLIAASVRVVSTLVAWEVAEEAAEKASLDAKKEKEEQHQQQAQPGTPRGQGSPLPPPSHSTSASLTTSPVRPLDSAAVHRDPVSSESRTAATAEVVDSPTASLLSRVRRGPPTSPETLAECLRTWLHFMGYVWKAFDDNACDPALSPEGQQDRASLAQKQRIHTELLRPAMRLRRCGEDVRTMTLRCVAQIGDDYLSTAVADHALGAELVDYVQTCLADPQPRVRGEALTTLGMWLWQYPSMDAFACIAIDNAVHSLFVDPNALVRTKAAFALSNVTSRLPDGSCPTVRNAPDYIATLCATALHAAVIDGEAGVQGHGIRMMNHLLQVLDFEELISDVAGFDEGVAEGFLRVLLECLRAATRGGKADSHHNARGNTAGGGADGNGWYAAPREAKHRWNAACALGMGLAREEVFEAEPKYAVEAVDALCTAVVRDTIFKVRTQAAGALGRIPGNCLSGTYSADDLTPRVVRSLCEALETATSTENFRQYKEQGSLHDALRAALATMITTAKPSIELDNFFASFQKLLQKERLI